MFPTHNPFHAKLWPRTIARPEACGSGDTLALSWDLGAVDESEKKQVTRAWVAKLPTLTHLKRLKLWTHVTQPVFDAACQLTQLEVLQVKWSNITDLSAITRLQRLQALAIGSSTRITSVEPLGQLSALTYLDLEHFKSVTDFTPLARLTNLQHLAVTGSMNGQQHLTTLEPFARMTWLTALALDTSGVTSLRPLAQLTQLQHLFIGGRLPWEEYAWLAAHLPHTECCWFQPWDSLAGSGIGRCPKCQQETRVMLTGRGQPTVCTHCDTAKVARHVERFEAAKMQAARGG